MNDPPNSCYGSMVASTSEGPPGQEKTKMENKLPLRMNTTSSREYIEAPAYFYDVDYDLKDFKSALKSTDFLQESGYQSVLERSQHPLLTSFVCTDDMSECGEEPADQDWDGYMTVGADRVKIKDMSDILASKFAFLSGARSNEGMSIVTFPDARSYLSFEDYQLLITYLIQVPQLDEAHKGFVVIIDRRNDKWSTIRNLFTHISSFFPGSIRVVFLLKPEGVLQRALEVGYRGVTENCNFKVVICESSLDLRRYLRAEQLTMDVGGIIKYNHLEWVQHRMDIERMKSSATMIAQSLADFGRTLRETELPNDVETTARILNAQTAERDAIKEDFRISCRKGVSLLRSVRQFEAKPRHEQLSPTRLHNVTAIERMLVQLEETEKSFDCFWSKHEKRLSNCLQLRQFEEAFRKLQAAFARHMIYLEEHREVGDGAEGAEQLEQAHQTYKDQAMEDVDYARELKKMGEELIQINDIELSGSLLPKCDELERMADALTGALERRTQVLRMSKTMHTQIQQANQWCKKGVEMLTSSEVSSPTGLNKMDEFLSEGNTLQLDALSQSPSMNSLILLTTTETSSLLAQVAERIDDIRRMAVARRDALAKSTEQKKPPIQVVTPEKKARRKSKEIKDVQILSMKRSLPRFLSFRRPKRRLLNSCSAPLIFAEQNGKIDVDYPMRDVDDVKAQCSDCPSTSPQSARSMSIEANVVSELLATERLYVGELEQLVEFYVDPFELEENQATINPAIRGRTELVFGNLRELLHFHSRFVLPDLEANENSPSAICRAFLQHRHRFLALYYTYCQNKTTSESVRKEFVESSPFFADGQRRAGHPLPLSAYLLKPVQRITRYQLLLRELKRHCRPEVLPEVNAALSAMLELLAQINAAIHQLHISGFNGDLRLLGALRLQSECDVYGFNRKKKSKLGRVQRRHLFLFDGGVLFCKKRSPPNGQPSQMDPEYFEHKMCIPTSSLGFVESSKAGSTRFELWDEAKLDAFAVEPLDSTHKERWSDRLSTRLSDLECGLDRQRPKSWASTVSNESTCSTSTRTSEESAMDTNGNAQPVYESPSFSPTNSPASSLDTSTDSDHVVPIQNVSSQNLLDISHPEEIELVEDC